METEAPMKTPLKSAADTVTLPAFEIPSFRTAAAIERGTERNLIFVTWGGLGDVICSEPTIRFAMRTFKGCEFSLATNHPELFEHLKFKDVFDLTKGAPLWDKYHAFEMIRSPESLQWQFMSHMLINAVDFPALCAFRCQIPVEQKEVTIQPSELDFYNALRKTRLGEPDALAASVAVHAGRHWQSKTFPKTWWDDTIGGLAEKFNVVLIGGDTDDNRGTVDVDASNVWCDARNKLSIMESVALLQMMPALVTNDSAPLHMAATGDAWIFYVATCKHPDFISHWRRGRWAWRMVNLGRGGIWEVLDNCPNKAEKVEAENVPEDLLISWLPRPAEVLSAVSGALVRPC